jgi:hypothetical protein
MHRDSKDFMQQTVMDDHADERAGRQERIDRAKRTVGNSCSNVRGEVIVEHFVVLAEEHLG